MPSNMIFFSFMEHHLTLGIGWSDINLCTV